MQDEDTDEHWLTLADAAPQLGCSVDTLRRRVKRGEIEARQVRMRHGPTWQVRLESLPKVDDVPRAVADGTPTVDPRVGSAPRAVADGTPTVDPRVGSVPRHNADGVATVELVRLVGRLQEENRQLAGQVGFLQAQTQQLQDQVKLLQAPPADQVKESGAEPEPARRRWWRRLWPLR